MPDPKLRKPLRQSSGNTTILSAVSRLREAETVKIVRAALLSEPLPKLQHEGRGPYMPEQSFLYDETQINGRSTVIKLKPGVAYGLAKLALLLRPVIETYWVGDVLKANDKQYKNIREQLFGFERISLARVRKLLKEHFPKQCFYCETPLKSGGEVDHVLPWSIIHLDGIANLVLACRNCNSSKSDRLPDLQHVDRALRRPANLLVAIGKKTELASNANAMRSAAISLYYSASADGRDVWRGRKDPVLVPLDLSTAPSWMTHKEHADNASHPPGLVL